MEVWRQSSLSMAKAQTTAACMAIRLTCLQLDLFWHRLPESSHYRQDVIVSTSQLTVDWPWIRAGHPAQTGGHWKRGRFVKELITKFVDHL
jgi:hypothetical protein